jgi:hypothetical protein
MATINVSDVYTAVSGSTAITSGTLFSGNAHSFAGSTVFSQIVTTGTVPTFTCQYYESFDGVNFSAQTSGLFASAGLYSFAAPAGCSVMPRLVVASGNMSGSFVVNTMG